MELQVSFVIYEYWRDKILTFRIVVTESLQWRHMSVRPSQITSVGLERYVQAIVRFQIINFDWNDKMAFWSIFGVNLRFSNISNVYFTAIITQRHEEFERRERKNEKERRKQTDRGREAKRKRNRHTERRIEGPIKQTSTDRKDIGDHTPTLSEREREMRRKRIKQAELHTYRQTEIDTETYRRHKYTLSFAIYGLKPLQPRHVIKAWSLYQSFVRLVSCVSWPMSLVPGARVPILSLSLGALGSW